MTMLKIPVYVKNIDRYVHIAGATTLLDIARSIASEIPFTPISAHVNNKSEDLRFPCSSPRRWNFCR